MKQTERDGRKKRLSEHAANGAVALIFLIIGFQLAIFVTKVVERPSSTSTTENSPAAAPPATPQSAPQPSDAYQARRFSSERSKAPAAGGSQPQKSKLGGYKTPVRPGTTAAVVESRKPRKVESFPFNPNTVTLEELVRLGLSERQAEVIEHYREKGGQFRTREDFAKMYVVSDSLFERLAPFIDIPKLELNAADSSALVELRGIGPYYASKILRYRDSLGGYYAPEQLMEIRGIDSSRFAGLAGSIRTDSTRIHPLRIWDLPEDSLAMHPYLGKNAARSIARYRRVYAMEPLRSEHYTLDALVKENVLTPERAAKLRPYCAK